MKQFLDETCKELNTAWPAKEAAICDRAATFEIALKTTVAVFGQKEAFRKYSENGFEPRFNRAVFDVMAFYFCDLDSKIVVKHAKEIKKAFENLCTGNPKFKKSIESTTKSISETATRLSIWGETLTNILKTDFPIPREVQGRIQIS